MIIVTGAAGQLGSDIVTELKQRNIDHIGIDIAELDITDGAAVQSFFKKYAGGCTGGCSGSSDVTSAGEKVCLIHCAAYTAVDKAEDERELCFKVNAAGTENLAKACKAIDAEMMYISTDYVFDGRGDEPIETDAVKGAVSVYGKSKLAGEEAVEKYLDKKYIVRISWVFGKNGPNFVKTMLRLAETKNEINVVRDQIGSPTYTPDLAKLLCDMALSEKYGIYHATNEGYCSWAEFAQEIMKQSGNGHVRINPITTEEYPAKAARPANSRLSKKSLDAAGFKRLPAWQDALCRYIENIQEKA